MKGNEDDMTRTIPDVNKLVEAFADMCSINGINLPNSAKEVIAKSCQHQGDSVPVNVAVGKVHAAEKKLAAIQSGLDQLNASWQTYINKLRDDHEKKLRDHTEKRAKLKSDRYEATTDVV